VTALEAALAGRPLDRPLLAPLFAALAAEVEQLELPVFLADPGRRARTYADLARELRPDVLVVDSGSGWDADPAGHALIADLLARVRAVVREPTALAVTLTGPATRGGDVQSVLAAARVAAEAGARVIFVREDVPAPPDGYARMVTPLWGSLKFFCAVGVLKVPGAGWAEIVANRGPFLPCVPSGLTAPGSYALAVAPGEAPGELGPRCALLTHTEDLAGHVPVRELQAAVAKLGGY
jgi:hypothetical protein